MSIRHATELNHHTETRKSGFGENPKPTETLDIVRPNLGQLCPQDYPQSQQANSGVAQHDLGDAIDITTVAEMLGCSPWTVRQRYLPQGLPHIRASARGRLVFFRAQVNRWILKRQQKGGK